VDEQQQITVECAHCGNTRLQQIPGTWTPLPMGEKGLVQGPAIPVVILGCPKCGYLQMFSPNAIKPIPFPAVKPQAAQEPAKQSK